MAFSLHDHWVWDFWLADDGEAFHMYYLHAPKSLGEERLRHRNARVGHATSSDLVNWTDLGVVLRPGGAGEFDETATWTGSIVRGDDSVWRMFYTGSHFVSAASTTNVQSVGVAHSVDLHSWVKSPGPIARADPRWYETLGTSSWPEEAWRDPWVFRDSGGEGWHMLVTARSSEGPDDERGVIGHATSADLTTWQIQPPLSAAGSGFAHLEVPQIATLDGRALLLFSCDTAALSHARKERGERGGIWAIAPETVVSDYAVNEARLVAPENLYSGRVIQNRDGQWVLIAFENISDDGDFVGRISDPLAVAWSDDDSLIHLNSQAGIS
jgi:beta-fructofuranosidase